MFIYRMPLVVFFLLFQGFHLSLSLRHYQLVMIKTLKTNYVAGNASSRFLKTFLTM